MIGGLPLTQQFDCVPHIPQPLNHNPKLTRNCHLLPVPLPNTSGVTPPLGQQRIDRDGFRQIDGLTAPDSDQTQRNKGYTHGSLALHNLFRDVQPRLTD